MSASIPNKVDVTLSDDDPGDEIARRFRFQSTCAAINCCLLLDSDEEVVEIFCEHHEDILVKYRDDTYSGLQIKTRASDQDLWRTGDEAVIHSCVKFTKLERDYPGQFRTFRFLTNHPFFSGKNSSDFRFVLGLIKAAKRPEDLPSNIQKVLRKIGKKDKLSDQLVFAALKKTEAYDDLPKLRDVETRLVYDLNSVWETARECTHEALRKAARNLANECFGCSSLQHEDTLPGYLSATDRPIDRQLAERIDGKRIGVVRLETMLLNGLNSVSPLIGDPVTQDEPRSENTDLLLRKLDAGGFSSVSRTSAEDLRDKAEYLGITWLRKFGRKEGLNRYDHIKSVVFADGAKAYEKTKTADEKFGIRMRDTLRSILSERRDKQEQLYDCSEDHLEGYAYSLTSQCKLKWSIEEPWRTDD
ncbi:MAG: dsDNA nuclease domain-containing protein [Pyrinomonadaceae bacterium]